MNEIYLGLIGLQIIPLFISILVPFDNFFVKLFIHNRRTISEHMHEFSYFITGQAIFVCPLCSWLVYTNFSFKINIPLGVYIFVSAIYLSSYICLLGKLLKMGPEDFEKVKHPLKFIYKYISFILTILSIICNLMLFHISMNLTQGIT